MELQTALETRKSIRKYKDIPVTHEMLIELLKAAQLAPSWKNYQTTKYYVAETKDMVIKTSKCLAEFNQTNTINAPVLIVSTVISNRAGYNKDGTPTNELHNEWGFYDCGLQNMNLCLKACELGLGTLIMGIRDADALREVFAIPENEMIASVISVGYPDIDPERPLRKTIEDIAQFR